MKINICISCCLMTLVCTVGTESIAEPLSTTKVGQILGRYDIGIKVLNDLKPAGQYSDTKVLYLPAAEIKARAGHSGGGVRQNPITKKYEILILDSLPDDQKAHAISHELQHVRDEIAFDKYLSEHAGINSMGSRTMNALSSDQRDTFIRTNREDVDFVLKGLFCQEARAYQANKELNSKGLIFQNSAVIANSAQFINDSYIKKFGVNISDAEAKSIEAQCLKARSFVSYVESIVPSRFQTNAAIPAKTDGASENAR